MASLCSHLGTVDFVTEAFYSLSIQLSLKAGDCEINASLEFLLKAHTGSFAFHIGVNAFQLIFNNTTGLQGFQSMQIMKIKFQVRA